MIGIPYSTGPEKVGENGEQKIFFYEQVIRQTVLHKPINGEICFTEGKKTSISFIV